VITPRKLRANQENSRRSTGPKSAAGKVRSAANALRHGLAVPINADKALAAEADALAQHIAGIGASPELLELSRTIAVAQTAVTRVRQARLNLLARELPEPFRVSSNGNMNEVRAPIQGPNSAAKSKSTPWYLRRMLQSPKGPTEFSRILANLTQQMAAMDRYERRALSERKFAIREFDMLLRQQTDGVVLADERLALP